MNIATRVWTMIRRKRDPKFPLVETKLSRADELHRQMSRMNHLRLRRDRK